MIDAERLARALADDDAWKAGNPPPDDAEWRTLRLAYVPTARRLIQRIAKDD